MPKKNKNYDYFLVQGGSMLPTIKHNQKIKILKTNNVNIGDIIVFKGNKKIIHRIVKFKGNKIVTKGDHIYSCDKPITYKEILGKVIRVGNKRIDNSYYDFINPFIAKMSYLPIRFDPRTYAMVRRAYKNLGALKMKLIGDKNLHIKQTIFFFLSLPHKINYGIFKLLKK